MCVASGFNLTAFVDGSGDQVKLHASARNVTIHIPTYDILIWFRFTGHADVLDNFMGISTFWDIRFQAEFMCMVENIEPGCTSKHPDILIINTGAHDKEKSMRDFAHGMQKLAIWLASLQRKYGTKVLWRGNNPIGVLKSFDLVARPYLDAQGIDFLDLLHIFEVYKDDLQSGCCSDSMSGNGLHVGVIGKYWANNNSPESRMTISSIVTQAILHKVLSNPHSFSKNVKC